uniref:MDS1 and EVI1 complex locus n=1 Tax=Mus musculus TaxID=10090 RepID=G3UYN3_MOUSE
MKSEEDPHEPMAPDIHAWRSTCCHILRRGNTSVISVPRHLTGSPI